MPTDGVVPVNGHENFDEGDDHSEGDSVTMEEEDDDDEDDDDSEAWSDDDQYHTANRREFSFDVVDSDDENDEEDDQMETTRTPHGLFRFQFARIHVLRALASMEDRAVGAQAIGAAMDSDSE